MRGEWEDVIHEGREVAVLQIVFTHASQASPDFASRDDMRELMKGIRTRLNLNPASVGLNLALAWAQLRTGDTKAAIESLRAIEESSNSNLQALKQIGFALAHAELGQEAEAIASVRGSFATLEDNRALSRMLVDPLIEAGRAIGIEEEVQEFFNGRLIPIPVESHSSETR